MGYRLCLMADFQILLFLEYFVFLGRFFAHNNSKLFVEWILTCFFEFEFLSQSEDFAWAIAFAGWPIFKNALISRIFGVFWSVFLHRTTVNDL